MGQEQVAPEETIESTEVWEEQDTDVPEEVTSEPDEQEAASIVDESSSQPIEEESEPEYAEPVVDEETISYGSVKVTLDVAIDAAGYEAKTYGVTIQNDEGLYLTDQGEWTEVVFPEDASAEDLPFMLPDEVKFSLSQESELNLWELPVGTYTITEVMDDTADIEGYEFDTPASTIDMKNVVVVEDQTTEVALQNVYQKIVEPAEEAESDEEAKPVEETPAETDAATRSDDAVSEDQKSDETADEQAAEDASKKDEKSSDKKDSKKNKKSKKSDEASDEKDAKKSEKDEDEKNTQKVFIYEGPDVSVTAELDDPSVLPAGVSFVVNPVDNTGAYLDALNGTAGDDLYNDRNTIMYDVSFVVADENGGTMVVEPAEGSVKVSFKFKNNQLVDDLGAKKAAKVDVAHLPEAGGDIAVETVDASGQGADLIQMTVDSFSVYAFSYTVDFTYDGFTYSIAGESEITLSELFGILGIDENVADVKAATFSDPSLVAVEQVEGDWLLTSLAPFTSSETLTVELFSGAKYEIQVTDAQHSNIRDFITTVSIPGVSSTQKAEPDKTYNVNIAFAESGEDLQFADNGLVYTFPEGFVPTTRTGQALDITIGRTGHTLTGNPWEIVEEGGSYKLHVSWSEDPDQADVLAELIASKFAEFHVEFEGKFDGTQSSVDFGGASTPIQVDTEKSVSVEKTGSFNNGEPYYTVTVSSHGKNNNVVISDLIDDNGAVSIDATAFASEAKVQKNYNDNNDLTAAVRSNGASSTGFSYTIPSMANGDRISITYPVELDYSKLDGATSTADLTGNTFGAKSDADKTGGSATGNLGNFTYTSTSKSGEISSGATDNPQVITWTTTINAQELVSVAGKTVADALGDGKDFTKLSGTGFTVQRKLNGSNVGDPIQVNWTDASAKSFTYTLPNDAADQANPYQYVITYTTESDMSGKLKDSYNVSNVATGPGGTAMANVSVGNPGEPMGISKRVKSVDKTTNDITWEVTIDVPATGLADATITDVVPRKNWGTDYFEQLTGDISATNLESDESMEVTATNDGFTVTFMNGDTAGLKGTGSKRTVTLTYTTDTQDGWVSEDKSGQKVEHTNTVTLKSGDEDVSASASKTFSNTTINKTGKSDGAIDGFPAYYYESTFSGVSEDSFVDGVLHLTDTFDPDIMEPVAGTFYIYSGNQYYAGDNQTAIGYTSTDEGMTIDIPLASIPKPSGEFASHYKVAYKLKVKDAAGLTELKRQAAGESDSKAKIENTISFDTVSADATVEYAYNAGGKTATYPKDNNNQEIKSKPTFTLTINPDEYDLNPDGNTVTVTDTFENLKLDYNTIKFTNKAGADITSTILWDTSGSTITMTIPDSETIYLTYTCEVIKTGNFKNTLDVKGQKSELSSWANASQGSGGSADNAQIRIKKYRSGDQNRVLGGAEFELLDADKNPVTKVSDGSPVTFKSGADGMVTVTDGGEEWSLWKGKRYYLREIKAPAGYKVLGYDTSFMIADATHPVDYGEYIYFNNDIMTAKNGNDAVAVTKVWEGDDEGTTHDPITIQLQQKMPGGDWSDEIVMPDESAENGWNNTTTVPSMTLELNEADGWHSTFEDLPAVYNNYEKGYTDETAPDIDYRVKEIDEIEGYGTEITGNAIDGFTITNTKGAVVGSGAPAVEKGLEGDEYEGTGAFEFTLAKVEKEGRATGDTLPSDPTTTVAVGDTSTFDNISFKEAGTYYYSITETEPAEADQIEGMSYTTTPVYAKADVAEIDGKLVAVWSYADALDGIYEDAEAATITNAYEAPEEETYQVRVSKVDAASGKELPGATIQVLGSDNGVAAEWTSAADDESTADVDESVHVVEGLKAGTYTLRETVAPEGYAIATDTTFTVDEEGRVTTTGTVTEDGVILVEDALAEGPKVRVSKVDAASGKELPGATIQVLGSDNGVAAEWTSAADDESTADVDESVHVVEGLKAGTYTLRETVAPEGYGIATDTTFTIASDGKVTTTGTMTEGGVILVEDAKTSVTVSKRDITGGDDELPGTKIQILVVDEGGNESIAKVDGKKVEWTSGDEPTTIEGLTAGQSYILRETVAPDGYAIATDTTFTIAEDGTVTVTKGSTTEDGTILVNDALTRVTISKVDVDGGAEVAGAKLQVLDEDGNVARDANNKKVEWTSTDKPHVVRGLKTGVEYTLHEVVEHHRRRGSHDYLHLQR